MSGSAQFRIERKETLEQRPAERRKLSAEQVVTTDVLVIGTRSNCDLVLDDPVAAEHHCAIRYSADRSSGGGFHVIDKENVTGTFLNGIPVEGERALAPGDRIALGVSIIECLAGDTPNELRLHVREGAFFYAIKKRGEFQSDADEWVRSEVTFGRMPALKALNLLAIAAAIAVVSWLWFMPTGQDALQPGRLSSVHAALFSESPPTAAHLASAVEVAQAQGCAACHESFDRPSPQKCAACHGDLVDSVAAKRSHPFEVEGALDCARCHREHHGEMPPPGTLLPVDVTQTCQSCHGSDFQDEASLVEGLALAATRFELAPTSTATVARQISTGFEAFNHGAHEKVNDCAACHEPLSSASAQSLSPMSNDQDFGHLTFEGCMRCHSAEPAGDVPAAWLPTEELRWTAAWHGAGEGEANCRSCHDAPYEGTQLTTSQVPPSATFFALTRRSHSEQFHGSDSPGDCLSCHKSGELTTPRMTLEGRTFRHEQHLSTLWPNSDQDRELIQAQCVECHGDIETSARLTAAPDSYTGPPAIACESCHTQDGAATLAATTRVAELPPTRQRPEFPHDRHGAIEGGCMACHSFDATNPGRSPVQTPEDIATCVRCHMQVEDGLSLAHASIGGGDSCRACHEPRGEAAPQTPLASVFYGPGPAPRAPSSFPHFLTAHQGATCTECHGEPTKGGDIHSPPESAESCRICHAANRFHWR